MNYKLLSMLLLALFTTSLVAAEIPKLSENGGMQFIKNDSNRTVVIALGDFFPTPYTLAPGSSTIAYVSTNRQKITIMAVD